eukprot:TRINITY_DN18398_c0_g1_i1.p1 TRINITY_DN18398_c0_g1~~TRINITY_DN18398_c0_g1_i1.p1  ORF type:complete len:107 (+),score=10.20 TRINITY_DN18398_c0_g1_i1:1-321(+)
MTFHKIGFQFLRNENFKTELKFNTEIMSRAVLLYRQLLKEGQKWQEYNFREYTCRRVREEFRKNRSITDPQKTEELLQFGRSNLELIHRQRVISNFFPPEKLVIEK